MKNSKTLVYLTGMFLMACLVVVAQQIEIEEVDFKTKDGTTVKAELGQYKVPENRNNPKGKMLTLSFVRFRSNRSNSSSPILYLAGGPGGSGIETAKGKRFELFMILRDAADVIVLDQRGTGKSNQLPRCESYARFNQHKPIHKKEYLEKTTSNIKTCLKFYKEQGHDLFAYNTIENAKDIEDLRKALGVNKISILGTSYGSQLAFEYIRNYETHIDKVVLSALEGPDQTIKLPSNTDDFVERICTKAEIDLKYANIFQTIKTVHETIKQNPVVTSFKNRKGKIDTVGISEYELKGIISNFYLKNPRDSKKLPALYLKMYHNDFSDIAQMATMVKRYAGAFRPMAFAMDMSSGISAKRNNKIAKQLATSIYGTSLSFLYYDWMNTLNFKQLPEAFRVLKKNHVNALLLSGDLDGRTYLKSAKSIAGKFKKGKHVIIKNAGHDLFMSSSKVTNLILDFFNGNEIKESTITLKPIIFD